MKNPDETILFIQYISGGALAKRRCYIYNPSGKNCSGDVPGGNFQSHTLRPLGKGSLPHAAQYADFPAGDKQHHKRRHPGNVCQNRGKYASLTEIMLLVTKRPPLFYDAIYLYLALCPKSKKRILPVHPSPTAHLAPILPSASGSGTSAESPSGTTTHCVHTARSDFPYHHKIRPCTTRMRPGDSTCDHMV